MTTIINLPETSDVGFFDNQTLAYLVPEIACITKLKASTSQDLGLFVFTIYLNTAVSFELAFSSYEEGRATRNNLLSKMAQYAGKENVIFSCGHNSEVAVMNAIDDITELFIKDETAAFTIFVKDVPFPLHVVDKNLEHATRYYQHIKNGIEFERRYSATEFRKVAVA